MNKRDILMALISNVITIAEVEEVCRLAGEYNQVHNSLLDYKINLVARAEDMPDCFLKFVSFADDRKIQAIKLIREYGGWGLAEAKAMSEGHETFKDLFINRTSITLAQATVIAAKFKEFGAVVNIVRK